MTGDVWNDADADDFAQNQQDYTAEIGGPEAAALMHKVTIGHGRYDYLPRQYDNCEDICIGE